LDIDPNELILSI